MSSNSLIGQGAREAIDPADRPLCDFMESVADEILDQFCKIRERMDTEVACLVERSTGTINWIPLLPEVRARHSMLADLPTAKPNCFWVMVAEDWNQAPPGAIIRTQVHRVAVSPGGSA